jgi:hypothetical protein
MMPAWYQRMNQRERFLGAIVVGAVFLLLNLYVWGKLFSALDRARTDLVAEGPGGLH